MIFHSNHAWNAHDDLAEIIPYVAADRVEAALSINDRLEHAIEILADNPRAGRERDDIDRDVRSFPVGSYIVFYRIFHREIAIIRVLHAARDPEWDPEDRDL